MLEGPEVLLLENCFALTWRILGLNNPKGDVAKLWLLADMLHSES